MTEHQPASYVIATAGHVDHGKSTLVQALTGIDPDRLKEEKERQLTIDLGFAWLNTQGGMRIGIVDVPGHRDFIENMLAGVGMVDAALLVVAADEGVMPQTVEHLQILDLLGVQRGVVAISRVDLAPEPDWTTLVEEEVAQLLRGTSLADSQLVRVCAPTGDGLDRLTGALEQALAQAPARTDYGRPRLGIDRAFVIDGFGTVVTGTLIDGALSQGMQVELQPGGHEARIRGLQTHKQAVEIAQPGTRVAVNLTGVAAKSIKRGQVLVPEGGLRESRRIDTSVRMLDSAESKLKHGQQVKLFCGASQVMATTRILGEHNVLEPGGHGWVQFDLAQPLAARSGDRFIIRRPSPPLTIAGGRVADPHPRRRHRKRDQSIAKQLALLLDGTARERAQMLLDTRGPLGADRLAQLAHLSVEHAQTLLVELANDGDAVPLTGAPQAEYLSATALNSLVDEAVVLLDRYHAENALHSGMPHESLRHALKLSQMQYRGFVDRLVKDGEIVDLDEVAKRADFSPTLEPDQASAAQALLRQFAADPAAPPSVEACLQAVGMDVYAFLKHSGQLVEVSDGVVFREQDYADLKARVLAAIAAKGPLSVAEIRDELGSTRRYVLALLEQMDRMGLTVREGDLRRLGGAA